MSINDKASFYDKGIIRPCMSFEQALTITLILRRDMINVIHPLTLIEILIRTDQHDLGEASALLIAEARDLLAGADRGTDRGILRLGIVALAFKPIPLVLKSFPEP